jgi:microcystin-dependent protein
MKQKKSGKILEILNSKLVIGFLFFVIILLSVTFAGDVIVKEGNLNITGRIIDQTGFVTPVGSVNAYAGTSSPPGWFLCNGSNYSRTAYPDLFAVIGITYGNSSANDFKVPDLRGIFIRGAGNSGILTNANGVAFNGTLGTYQNDQFQGHYHKYNYTSVALGTYGGPNAADSIERASGVASLSDRIKVAITDGTDGTPRTGTETNPANLGLNYIIKY